MPALVRTFVALHIAGLTLVSALKQRHQDAQARGRESGWETLQSVALAVAGLVVAGLVIAAVTRAVNNRTALIN